jgi:glycosyltransferase involved in cell wall biosynthesis
MTSLPFVSICTPTFNRRPFYPMIISCFQHQLYPKDRMEWIIIDDGTDKIGDLVKDIPQVRYYAYDERMNLGKKRNLMHEKATGDILVYMDDDDYYPPERVSHAVEMLQKHPNFLIAGSSLLYIYFKHIHKMYEFGPYAPYHSTAALFAFRKELLQITRYDDNAALAEEKDFLQDYKIPLLQLDPKKCILVFSHEHNSFDKKTLLETPSPKIKESTVQVQDLVKEPDILTFFLKDIDGLLAGYDPGKPENKPEVMRQIQMLKEKRERAMFEHGCKMEYQKLLGPMNQRIAELTKENEALREKNEHLHKKLAELVAKAMEKKKQEKKEEKEKEKKEEKETHTI